jgi:pimeloyl-ACP methyl ester carboxylesterase
MRDPVQRPVPRPAPLPARTRRAGRLTGAAVAVILTASITTATGTVAAHATARAPAPVPNVPVLSWQPCDGGFECATAEVPLDYDAPGGPAIDIAVIRHVAADPAHRIGSVFFNPGGPGGAGTDALPSFYTQFPQQVRDRFDVVSFDPRGVGRSTAVQCYPSLADEQRAFAGVPPAFPVGEAETRTWIDRYAAFGRACGARRPALLPHLSTANVAKDMDLLRQAVGDPGLSYIGVSYGTYLGATYANLFPRHVRALVLDGNIDPVAATTGRGDEARRLAVTLRFHQDEGMAATLRAFADLCGATDVATCAFAAGSPTATRAKWATLLERLKANPVTVGDTTYTYNVVVGLTGEILYATRPVPGLPGWQGLAAFLQQLWNASAAPPGATAASGTPAPRPPTAPTPLAPSSPGNGLDLMRAPLRPPARPVPADPSAAAPADTAYTGPEQQFAITCSDTPNPRDPASYRAQAAFAAGRSGDFGRWRTWAIEPCATWPAMDADRYTGPWNRPTANPILVVGNTTDPGTPYVNSLLMARELSRARLLTVDGYGHTAFLNKSTCADAVESAYLVRGALPPPDTVCRQDQPPFS